MLIRQIRVTFSFYKYFCLPPALLSVLFCFIYRANEDSILVAIAAKLLTDAAIWYFLTSFYGAYFYYYYNLHISKTILLVSFFIFDMLLLIIGLWITHHFL